jgi:hypothetical protein
LERNLLSFVRTLSFGMMISFEKMISFDSAVWVNLEMVEPTLDLLVLGLTQRLKTFAMLDSVSIISMVKERTNERLQVGTIKSIMAAALHDRRK